MFGNKNSWRFVGAVLLAWPGVANADRCTEVYRQGDRAFASAQKASAQKHYGAAAQLYQEAGRYYERVTSLKDCSCPMIPGHALHNAAICKGNAELMRQNLASEKASQAEPAASARPETDESAADFVSHWAQEEYEHGEEAASRRQWDDAIQAFESAAGLWDSLALSRTENGRKARLSAKEAREAADQARQNKGQ